MFALLRRFLPIVLGLLLLALVIWFAGPYFEFADYYRPLESATARLIVIAVVIGLWAASRVLKRMRGNRASDQLAAAVVKQADAEPRPSADVVQLRERFEEAVAALKQKRRGGHSLYELPWYVIIGAPGSGKTTALINSGLHFPLEQRTGRGALRGVGGTRNCDWWFTDEAVLLDTAGRYTTQDSDASADSTGWLEFLALLRKYRKRRPVNGVILTISAQDLMAQGQGVPEGHVEAARRRLIELNKQLHIQLPVYLMVTKCDLVSGFAEYFEDLDQEGRAQVWGVTFPYEKTLKGDAPQAFPAEFDALMTRLNERVFARVEADRDFRRRTKAFGFPQQMASLREGLSQYITEVFSSTRFDQPVQLRGVYFTSGTQEGTPIDRLLGAIGRRFAVAPDAVMQPVRGKAYFIEHLLKNVLFAESGLAGVNRRFEVQMAAAQTGAYIAMAAVAILGVILWTVSYRGNRNYIDEVSADVARLQQVPPAPANVALDAALPRLDAVRAVYDSANRYTEDRPWSMRWGLFQGNSVSNAAHDAYVRELGGALLPRVEALLRQRLLDYAAQPEAVYEYLKVYLMLGDRNHFDRDHVAAVVDEEWKAAYAATPATAESLSRHFRTLLEDEEKLREIELDPSLIAQARTTIRQASKPRIVYSAIKYAYTDDPRVLRLNETTGIGAERVLRRKSGRSLSEPIPALYTKPVFEEVTGKSTDELARQYMADYWVWGDAAPSPADLQLTGQIIDVYEKDYIAYWDGILQDFDVSFQSAQTADALAILSGPTSPLRSLYRLIDQHTYFPKPTDTKPTGVGVIDSAKDRLSSVLGRGRAMLGVTPVTPGQQITAYFARIHALVAGEGGATELDRVLGKLGELQKKLGSSGAVGGTDATDPNAVKGSSELVQSIRQDASALPPAVGGVVNEIANRAAGVVREDLRGELEARYQQEVVGFCREIVDGKYPFVKTSAVDAQPEDFSRLFGPNALLDMFFKQRVEPLANTITRPWRWKPDASGVPVGGSPEMLRRFELAQSIRDNYFPNGPLKFDFRVLSFAVDTGTSRFVLDIDGQRFNYQFGPDPNQPATWPGPTPGSASVTWEERGGGRAFIAYTGRWAWQRLIDAAEVQTETDVRYALTWRRGNHQATVKIEAVSVRNPFNKADVQQFRCG